MRHPRRDAKKEDWFAKGVQQFNARKYFDAHESWETIWLAAREPDKTFLQAITQVSAAFHHASRGNHAGAKSLLRKGLKKLEDFPAKYRGLKLEKLRECLRAWAELWKAEKQAVRLRRPRMENAGTSKPRPVD